MRIRAAIRIPLVRLGFLVGRLLGRPPRRVVLATSHSRAISGNLAYIREELTRREPPITTISLAYRPVPTIRGLLSAAIDSFRSGYHLARAVAPASERDDGTMLSVGTKGVHAEDDAKPHKHSD